MRRPSTAHVLNLCFHGVGTPSRPLEPDEERFWIEPDVFDAILDVLAPVRAVRITFDDGNASDVEVALPALRERGLHAAFFVVAGRCGEVGSVSAEDVRELARHGMTIGSHGMRHRPWRGLDNAALHEELHDARDALAEIAGMQVDEAACPFGSYDRRVLHALRREGFARVYTVDEGLARRDAWLQARYTIRSDDTPDRIDALVHGPRRRLVPQLTHAAKTSVKRWR